MVSDVGLGSQGHQIQVDSEDWTINYLILSSSGEQDEMDQGGDPCTRRFSEVTLSSEKNLGPSVLVSGVSPSVMRS